MTLDVELPPLPSCGHCGATLRHDAVMLGIDDQGDILTIAAEHRACLSEWGIVYENGTIYHVHEIE